MSLVVRCGCGKAFQAPPALAGKQVKCPACGGILVVPQAVAQEPPGITATCNCGGRFMAKAALAGKMVRCPKCSATLQVPMPGSPNPGPAAATTPTQPASGPLDADPFAGLDLGANLGGFPASFPTSPSLPAASPYAAATAPQAKAATKASNSTRWIWMIVAIVGGGLGVLCLGCAGLFVVGFRQAIREAQGPSANEMLAAVGMEEGTGSQTLVEARQGFVTTIVSSIEPYGPPTDPTGSEFDLIHYNSPVGPLAAYLTRDPGDGQKHPAIVWITGGDCNSIDNVWLPQDRSDDQTASAFRKAGIVMMFPSQRGGNENPGEREGFYGEVDDILAATDHLASLPYIDPGQIYLGGHSTGGTMVMVVGECTDRYRAVFALGPVATAGQYGGDYVYCDTNDDKEIALRSPLLWLHCVKSPMYVFEGGVDGNWDAIQEMVDANSNPKIQFFKIPGHDHFTVIAPLTERLAAQIVSGNVNVTQQTLQGL